MNPRLIRSPVESRYRSSDDIVLSSMPIREDADRARLSRFGDDRWYMTPGIFQTRARHVFSQLDFTNIGCPIERLTAKEYIFASLNHRLADPSSRLRPAAARVALRDLQRFMDFARERLGRFEAAMIDQDMIDAYRSSLITGTSASPRQITRYLKPTVELRRLAPYLTCGGLTFLPWGGRTLYRVAGCGPRGDENRTPRIPEPVIGALLHWSLEYIDLFSADIFAARAELDALEMRFAARQGRTRDVVASMTAWIDERRRMGRGVPVWSDPVKIGGTASALLSGGKLKGDVVNMRLMGLQSGLNHTAIYDRMSVLRRCWWLVLRYGMRVARVGRADPQRKEDKPWWSIPKPLLVSTRPSPETRSPSPRRAERERSAIWARSTQRRRACARSWRASRRSIRGSTSATRPGRPAMGFIASSRLSVTTASWLLRR